MLCRWNHGDPSIIIYLGCYTSILKTQLLWFGLEPPTRLSRSKSAHKCIPYNNSSVQNFIQISWDLAVRGPKTSFWVKTENGQANYSNNNNTCFTTIFQDNPCKPVLECCHCRFCWSSKDDGGSGDSRSSCRTWKAPVVTVIINIPTPSFL